MYKIKLSFIMGLVWLFISFSCQRNNDFPLNEHFKELEKNSPKNVIKEFKTAQLDSAVIHYDRYPEIFSDVATMVLQDSLKLKLFEDFFKENGIDLVYQQDLYTIVAAFHKWLNNEKIDIKKLNQEMIDMSNEYNEKKYGKPDLH